MVKIAKKSFGEGYVCEQEWDEDCFVQCGERGLVLSEKGNYNTAFFEAFPKNPKTFLRGEGSTLQEAEKKCWDHLQRILSCDEHDYIRYHESENAKCKKCGLFTTEYFPPIHSCHKCGKEHVNNKINKEYYCIEHFIETVEDLEFKVQKTKSNNQLENLFASLIPDDSIFDYYRKTSFVFRFMIENNLFKDEKDYLRSREASKHVNAMHSIMTKFIVKSFADKKEVLTYDKLDEISDKIEKDPIFLQHYFFNKEIAFDENKNLVIL